MHDFFGKQMRGYTDPLEPVISGIVVVLFGLFSRIRYAFDLHVVPSLDPDLLNQRCQLINSESLHDLIEYPQLPMAGRILL